MKWLSVSDARRRLPQPADEVAETGEAVVITRRALESDDAIVAKQEPPVLREARRQSILLTCLLLPTASR
jgi:hypothetical protein